MQCNSKTKQEEEHIETTIAQIADKDPFNLSNDYYYHPENNLRFYPEIIIYFIWEKCKLFLEFRTRWLV